MDEAHLIARLARIEALFAGALADGEHIAGSRARDGILVKLRAAEAIDPAIEYRFTMADMWSRRVFLALLRRYEIRPYRYPRQRRTTVMARVSRRFVDETLWPEFEQLTDTLRAYLSEVTDRVICEAFHGDASEAEVVKTPPQLALELDAPAAEVHAPAAASPGSGGALVPESPPAPPAASAPAKGAPPRRKTRKKKKRKRR